MKKSLLTAILILEIILVFQNIVCGQNSKILKFADGSEIELTDENFTQNITSIKFVEKELIATFYYPGKANRLPEKILSRLKRENRNLFKKSKKITTSYDLEQDGGTFYIRTLDTGDYENLRDCNKCRVFCKLVVMEISLAGGKIYLPLIKSIKKMTTRGAAARTVL